MAAKLGELDYDYERADDGIKVLGQAAHASVAEMGVNAIARLCIALHAIGLESKVIRFVAQQVGEDPFATLIFGQCTDAPSGQLKFNVGKIDIGHKEQLAIDIRIPVTVPKEEIVHKLSTVAGEYGLAYREYDWTAPIYMPLDHPMIKTLIMVYREVTGDIESEPESSGGATFARSIEKTVLPSVPFYPEDPQWPTNPTSMSCSKTCMWPWRCMPMHSTSLPGDRPRV